MSNDNHRDVTHILQEWSKGGGDAHEELLPLVYGELKRQARRYLQNERSGHTLQPTALVHEAYLRLVDQTRVSWQSREHFFGVAAQAMRRILVDHARAHAAEKRGGNLPPLPLDEAHQLPGQRGDVLLAAELLALDEALELLAKEDERAVRVVEMRYFGGYDEKEIAEYLDVSTKTVEREWDFAKRWLRSRLAGD